MVVIVGDRVYIYIYIVRCLSGKINWWMYKNLLNYEGLYIKKKSLAMLASRRYYIRIIARICITLFRGELIRVCNGYIERLL